MALFPSLMWGMEPTLPARQKLDVSTFLPYTQTLFVHDAFTCTFISLCVITCIFIYLCVCFYLSFIHLCVMLALVLLVICA